LILVSWKNDELTTNALPIHGYEHYKEKDYALAYAPFSGLFDHVVIVLAIYFLRDELF
jgi:hypothetical protein